MHLTQRDFLGRNSNYPAVIGFSMAEGMNPGSCKDGNTDMIDGCANVVEFTSATPFRAMFDIESSENLYTGDNTLQYDYSLYCRWVEPPVKVSMKEFCASQKESGTYKNGNEEVTCHKQGANMYTFVAKQAATGVLSGKQEKLVL